MEINLQKQESEYLYKIIDKIIKDCGPRMPCSPQEAKAAEIIRDELQPFCDKVSIEKFYCSPRAFLGWIRVVVTLIAISFINFLLISLLSSEILRVIFMGFSLIINLVVLLIMWKEFFNYDEFIDKLFKKKPSQNVIGKINSKGEKKRILIFSGHHDSALQFNLLRYLKIGYIFILFIGIAILLIWALSSLIIFILELINQILRIGSFYNIFFNITLVLLIIGIIPLISLFNFTSFGEKANKVPGAVDNLSAVSIILGIAKYLKEHKNIIPDNVEIQLISFGCEEAGLRGAYRYVEQHIEELKEYDTININMDALQNPNRISIIEYEPTTRTKHSKEVVESLIEIGKSIGLNTGKFGAGKKEKMIGQFSGGTDATAFSKANIKAATINSMSYKGFLDYYHQPDDILDKIEPRTLETILELCLTYVKEFNKEK